jgi:hypothetical protein
MKHTNISQYIRENKKEFKQHILNRKTEKELSKIYGCSNATIIAMKKELKLQSGDLLKENKFNHKSNITHCKSCGKKSKKNTCSKCVQKRSNIAKKELLVERAGGKCVRCGYKECIAALDFHHVDPKTKDINLNTNLNIDIKLKEIEKCILLCCRCHRELHWQETIDFIQANRYAIDKTKERLFPSH